MLTAVSISQESEAYMIPWRGAILGCCFLGMFAVYLDRLGHLPALHTAPGYSLGQLTP